MSGRLVILSVGTNSAKECESVHRQLLELSVDLAKTHGYVSVSASEMDAGEELEIEAGENLYYDDQTLTRATNALVDDGFLSATANNIINTLLNNGFLLREQNAPAAATNDESIRAS